MFVFQNLLDNVSFTSTILVLFVCVIILSQWFYKHPGPNGLPYLGYYPFLRDDCHVQLFEMGKKYGEVFFVSCTGQLYVHLGSLKAIKEAHITKSDCFRNRTTNFSLFQDTFALGLGFSNDEKWKVLKKFFAHHLKELGLGRKSQESLIGDGLQKTIEILRISEGKNIDALKFFTETSTEAILSLLLSGTKVDDDEVKGLLQNYRYMAEVMATRSVLLAGPLLKYVLQYLKPDIRKYQKCKSQMESILHNVVSRHKRKFSKDNKRGLVDFFLCERRELEEKRDPKSDIFSDSALVSTILQFFGDGSLSIGLLIALILRDLACRPDVQKQIQRELDEVVGTNRFPTWDDRSRTPYTNAVIYENLRTSDFFPFFPSLECTKGTTIQGCNVPKGAITLVNFWAALRDPDVYQEPEKFDPLRFLPAEGRKTREELPIIFGVGKRSCIGEPLTHMQIFLFVTTVLQNFNLNPAKDDPNLQAEGKNAYAEESIFLRATPRKV